MSTSRIEQGARLANPERRAALPALDFHIIEDEHEHHETGTMLGFWLYLMSDCLLFGILFVVHAVVGMNTAGGPIPSEIFEIDFILLATFMLLFSSITYGFAVISMNRGHLKGLIRWLIVTGVFGLAFLGLELKEFNHLIHIGATPGESAFLSSFWVLVSTHGLHVTAGTIWLVVLIFQLRRHGINEANRRRVMCLSLFWHFLDLIWIGVFSFVYLAAYIL
ncbi:MAG: cytochrome o ubiquinol oxidase subunit III [Pseudomonadota bacterium]